MRNFTEAVVITTDVFKGSYNTALAKARSLQSKVTEADNVSYTVEGSEDGEATVRKHEGKFGGQPPYQPIVHKSGPITTTA